MRIICVCCGKQAISEYVGLYDPKCTTLQGARAAIEAGTCYCGHCSKDLDENGLFPEERSYNEAV